MIRLFLRWWAARPIDQLTTLKPRVVVRDDGLAYITFARQ
jgi:hypothetical protein